jgi:hypothetical protein
LRSSRSGCQGLAWPSESTSGAYSSVSTGGTASGTVSGFAGGRAKNDHVVWVALGPGMTVMSIFKSSATVNLPGPFGMAK